MSDVLDIAELRKEIDGIDDEILRLLNRRAKVVIKVGEVKARTQATFHVPARERAILDRLSAENTGPFPTEALRPVFREILSACLSLEAPLKVAYLGPDASFTHLAARQRFGLSAVYAQTPTIPAVFDEVSRGRADYGVVPIEDSVEGVMQHTLDSFLESELKVVGEVVVEVAHHLLGRMASTAEVEKVHATAQALSACQRWLSQNLPNAVVIEASSTAAAAEAASDDRQSCAIGPELVSELYDLRIVKPRLDDQPHNHARLLVLGRSEPAPTGRDKTSLLFTLADEPGGLFRVLGCFKDAGVNLTKIESRPSRKRAWDYSFFIDVDGHAKSPPVAQALAELGTICTVVRVLGSYPRAETPEV
jgi:chorismate mutase/prephenate dehydratase